MLKYPEQFVEFYLKYLKYFEILNNIFLIHKYETNNI